jgi:hypothetical protein
LRTETAAHHAAGGAVAPQAAGPGGFAQLPPPIGQVVPMAAQADPRLAAWLYAQSLGIPAYGSGAGWNWAVNRTASR